ncbi:MAG TPA: GDSL-type esterase/lipase family protein, partial [Steroidobacteraceae bacterium]|nr:GDSL-type esterase/lipase family protein [Steroidobacteraceae bacterium]
MKNFILRSAFMQFNRRTTVTMAAAWLLIALASCATQVARQDQASQGERWVGTWGASPTVPAQNGQGFNNQTLRLIVHATLGGDEVRIRITNAFGTKPLVVGAASVALQQSGAAIAPNSNRALTFNGRATATIPPAALIVSDPVKLHINAQQNLAVSIFLPSETGPATVHPLATQESFVSGAGNFVANADAAPFATTIQTWPLLSEVEVRNNTVRSIVTFGDSITDGFKSTVSANHRWPDYFTSRLLSAGQNVSVVNEAISGNRLLHDSAGGRPIFGPNGLSRFDRDVLAVSNVSHIVVLIGINDIGMGSPARNPEEVVSADEIIAGLHQLTLRAHARGLKIIGATLTPFRQAAYITEEGEAKRQAVNNWIRATKDF